VQPRARHRDEIRRWLEEEQRSLLDAGLTRRPSNESRFLEAALPASDEHPAGPRGLVVLLHGFSAGTLQWALVAERLRREGYDVWLVSLPGHGLLREGQEYLGRIPTSRRYFEWERFAEELFSTARSAERVAMASISAGGMVALKAAIRHGQERGPSGEPILRQIVAVSPLLGFTNPAHAFWLDLFGSLRELSPALGRLLLSKPVDFGPDKAPDFPRGFRYPRRDHVYALKLAAEATLAKAHRLKDPRTGRPLVPLQLVISGTDETADPQAMTELARRTGAEVLHFDDAPHPIVHPVENPNRAQVQQVEELLVRRLRETMP
jgi:alpha-beta hydrolase superfamily lysophospholipase